MLVVVVVTLCETNIHEWLTYANYLVDTMSSYCSFEFVIHIYIMLHFLFWYIAYQISAKIWVTLVFKQSLLNLLQIEFFPTDNILFFIYYSLWQFNYKLRDDGVFFLLCSKWYQHLYYTQDIMREFIVLLKKRRDKISRIYDCRLS